MAERNAFDVFMVSEDDDDDEFPITHIPDLSPFNSDEEDILEFSTVNELMSKNVGRSQKIEVPYFDERH